jgi:hypothetical protein
MPRKNSGVSFADASSKLVRLPVQNPNEIRNRETRKPANPATGKPGKLANPQTRRAWSFRAC